MCDLPALTHKSGFGPVKSRMAIFISVTISRVGQNIQKVSIKIICFLSYSAMILNGEICAFRHAARMAAAENPGKEIIIYTDNANVFHAIQKGRSRSKPLNILCRDVSFLEILHGVRIHARWIPSADMPADKYTRRATFPGKKQS